jgi:hypothetical protein
MSQALIFKIAAGLSVDQHIRNSKSVIESGNAGVNFALFNDEWRCNDKVVDPCIYSDSRDKHLGGNLIHNKRRAFQLLAGGIESSFVVWFLTSSTPRKGPTPVHHRWTDVYV